MKNLMNLIVAVLIVTGCNSEDKEIDTNTVSAAPITVSTETGAVEVVSTLGTGEYKGGHLIITTSGIYETYTKLNQMYAETDSLLENGLESIGDKIASYGDIMSVVNSLTSVTYMSDDENYGSADKWNIITDDIKAGDCEDFALTAMLKLLEMGIDPETLSIELGTYNGGAGHAMLKIEVGREFPVYISNARAFTPLTDFSEKWKVSTVVKYFQW